MNLFKIVNLLFFASLCLIWGSSYILIKLGLFGSNGQATLSAYQVAAFRIIAAGVCLLPFFIHKFQRYTLKTWAYLIVSGLLVMFFPTLLFCVAETGLDSALAAILNVLTPVFVILFGYLSFAIKINIKQGAGVILAFLGVILLLGLHKNINFGSWYDAGYAVLATMCYAVNALIVKHKLKEIPSLTIASLSFVPLIIPAIIILVYTHGFSLAIKDMSYIKSTAAACLLGVLCSSVAWIVFYELAKRSNAMFASSVSFITPIVALFWGWLYGESINLAQGLCMLLILIGIYLTNPELKIRFKKSSSATRIQKQVY